MLFFLSGNIQTGKTRWLQRVIADLEGAGVPVAGVIAPGTWIEHPSRGENRYEKTGIENELLPSHEHIAFARRVDLAADAPPSATSQARRAGLGWAIEDAAIAQVNAHFETLAARTGRAAGKASRPGLVVVDEFGRLELERDEGLVQAVALVDRGATPTFPHALVVVRAQLLETARARFANAPWDGMAVLAPGDEARARLSQALGA